MKLRIAHVDSNTMAGIYIVQERRWFSWEDLYFDIMDKQLRREQVLGRGGISQAQFSDWHEAWRHAQNFRTGKCRRVIKQVWEVK
jgi:hypothetical protein